MKKISNINLAGRVIPIEDSAYESLKRYIESLRRYFANEEGREEIINDIESRVAELMNDKVRRGAHAITDADVEEIIQSMGRVEDFEEADRATETETTQTGTASGAGPSTAAGSGYRPKGRLYRNTSDKFLGGVCSGIAAYMNVDPSVVRLLFAIITFGGFGFGFLLYILLWIVLPTRELDTYVGKRLFRNPDDKVIGGVAGGLAAYFNRSASTIRLIFAAPLILNIFFSLLRGFMRVWHYDYSPVDIAFGSITSTFFLIYIVLWIVLPEAKSDYDKMEMRGEKIDVNRIRQNVQEGMGDWKSRAQAFGDEVKDSAQRFSERARNFAETRGKTFATEAGQTVKPVASGIGHAIGVLFKAFFLFIAGSIAFALFVGLMMLIFGGGAAIWPVKQALLDFVLDGFWQKAFFWGTLVFFVAVPLIGFLTWLIRRIMRIRSTRSYLGWTFGALWTIGIISLVCLVSSLSQDFRMRGELEQQVAIAQPPTNKMLVTVSEPEIRYDNDLFFTDADNNGWNFTDDSLQLGNVHVRVVASKDSTYKVSILRSSQGRSSRQAEELASKIRYNVVSRDSTLDLGSGYSVSRSDKWRNQVVEVLIEVPIGKKIRFDQSVDEKLSPYQIRKQRRRKRYGDEWYINDERLAYKTNVDYTMAPNGDLVPEGGRVEERGRGRDINNEGPDYDEPNANFRDSSRGTRGAQDSLERIRRQQLRIRDSINRELERTEDRIDNRQGYTPTPASGGENFDLIGSVMLGI